MRARAFTLLELMVVIVIVGVMVAMFTLSVGVVGGADREMSREMDRLASLLRLGLEDAEFQSRNLGLRFYPDGYEFSTDVYRIVDGESVREWTVLADDFFRPHELPPTFEFELEIDGRAVHLDTDRDVPDRRYQPQIFILSSGDMSDAFVVRLRQEDEGLEFELATAIDGTTEIIREED